MNALLLALAVSASAAAPKAPAATAEKTYTVEAGKSEVIAVTGGKVKLTGPAEATVSASGIELKLGRLLLALPRLAGRKFSVRTAHAVAAVRGTEFYVETADKTTYICACEGRLRIGGATLHASKAKRHSAIEYTQEDAAEIRSAKAGLKGHSDEEFPSLRAP